MFNRKSIMTGLLALFCAPMMVNSSNAANNANNKAKISKSKDYNLYYNNVLGLIRSSKERPTVTLVPSSKAISDLISQLLGIDKLAAKAEALMPKVQQKIKTIGENRAELEKDPDVKEFMELSLKGQLLNKKQGEIMEAALEMFSGAVSAMQKNVVILVVGGNLIYDEDAADDNHIFIQAQKFYTQCIKEAYANLKEQEESAKVDTKEVKHENSKPHNAKHSHPNSSAELKSTAGKANK